MHIKRRIFLLIIIVIAVLLAGCSIFKELSLVEKIDKIKRYMTQEEVIKIMGEDYKEVEKTSDREYSLIWINEDDTEAAEVFFDKDGDAKKVVYFDKDDWEMLKGYKEEPQESVDAKDKDDEEIEDIKEEKVDNEPLDDKDEEDKKPLDTLNIGSKDSADAMGGYEFGEFDKYNSPASENGLGGSKIYVYGKCTEIVVEGSYVGCFVENGKDKWYIAMWDTSKLGEKDFSLLEGKEIYVFGEYLGYSSVVESPAMIFDTILCDGMSYDYLRLTLGGVLSAALDADEEETTVADEPSEENDRDISDRVSYDMFIERFDEMLIKMTKDEDSHYLRDYEFEQTEPDEYQCDWEVDGKETCTIALRIEDDYISSAIFIGEQETLGQMMATLALQSSFEVGMLGFTLIDKEYDETYTFGKFDAKKKLEGTISTVQVFYLSYKE